MVMRPAAVVEVVVGVAQTLGCLVAAAVLGALELVTVGGVLGVAEATEEVEVVEAVMEEAGRARVGTVAGVLVATVVAGSLEAVAAGTEHPSARMAGARAAASTGTAEAVSAAEAMV
ncbi:hypothetical protein AB1Y20_013736 [Prymnesium parvum]|uniref:H(+)-exporting diphosphatase n=1 Tax=Prymnesium parvum TaxID=97485 RepID=A0AB34IGK8_PRYPA|mmetsp:Transcript_19604/g.48982  ORF Transcript_19604/g.48982 Transcript_19604/m.48982 type:complete len:117 (+) Transcript_19604:440-790(+)